MQGAYYQEAVGMKSLKMLTLSRYKRRAKLYMPPISASTAAQYRAVNGNSRTFATLPSSVKKVALMQGAYYQEAMGMKSLKMQTLSWCKWRTKLYGPANICVHCSAV